LFSKAPAGRRMDGRKMWIAVDGGSHMGNDKSQEPGIIVENGTDVTIVTFEDENILEEQQIRKLERALLPVVRANQDKRLVLNFANVKFMSSAFLGLLVKVHKRVVELNGRLQLYNLDPKIHKVFEITKLVKIFDIVSAAGPT
jgi:anti-anti-sigma factor